MKHIYLDYAATTPVDKRVVKSMEPYFFEKPGNSMSLHFFGQEAKLALENSRQVLAEIINAQPNEIVFTSSATESNNTALKGVALANKAKGKHIIISAIEHPCIMESAKWLEKNGFEITRLPVDKYGLVNLEDVKSAIGDKTILVSVMHASNEIGTIEPIAEIGKICREKGVYFHTDASQSFSKIAIDVEKMNIDLLTASSHKIYGPKGAGLLYVRSGVHPVKYRGAVISPRAKLFDRVKIDPILHGGGQENGLRGSTINVPAIVGFAKAAEICQDEMKQETKRLIKLRDKLIKAVFQPKAGPPRAEKIRNAYLTGHPTKRLPNLASFGFDFIEGESLVMRLDLEGIACSTGSACSSFKLEPSHVLTAIGLKPEQAHGSLRVSLGRYTTEKEIARLIKVLPGIIKKIREISPYGKK